MKTSHKEENLKEVEQPIMFDNFDMPELPFVPPMIGGPGHMPKNFPLPMFGGPGHMPM